VKEFLKDTPFEKGSMEPKIIASDYFANKIALSNHRRECFELSSTLYQIQLHVGFTHHFGD
jgi:carbamate kinase